MKRAPVNFELASSGHRRGGEFFVAPYLFYSSRPLTGDAHFLLTPPATRAATAPAQTPVAPFHTYKKAARGKKKVSIDSKKYQKCLST